MEIKECNVSSSIGDKKFCVRSNDVQADFNVINEVFVGDVYKLENLKRNGFEPKFAIDVGGHIGSFMVKAKTLWPDLQIVAFEPVKDNFALYNKNIEINNFTGVTVINKGIMYDKERTVFVNGKTATGGGMFINPAEVHRCCEEDGRYELQDDIQFSTLEEELKPFTFDKIDLAKFDCEGGEREAFRQMSDEILNKIRYVVGEFHVFEKGKNFVAQYCYRFKNYDIIIPQSYMDVNIGPFYMYPKDK